MKENHQNAEYNSLLMAIANKLNAQEDTILYQKQQIEVLTKKLENIL